jgi:hypothetical protein
LKKIAIIEIGGSHHECIYSQLGFIKSPETEITLICSANLKNAVSGFEQVNNFHFIDYEKGEWKGAFKVKNILNKNDFDAVVINTAHGKRVRNFLILPFLKKQNFTGIAHNTKKFTSSNTQKIINTKVKKYFVLAQYLLKDIPLSTIKGLKFDYFYSMFYPKQETKLFKKGKDEIWICIPGQVEYKRRDYKTLFNQVRAEGLNPNIKLIFLGKSKHKHGDGVAIEKEINSLGIASQCILWDGFIDDPTFYSYLLQSDYLLPLIHKGSAELSNYFTNQISGTFNLAFGYGKPLLLENAFKEYEDFKEDGLFYETGELVNYINSLESATREHLYKDSCFGFEELKKRYLELVSK